ncbi:MAG: SDR family oxidoreductase [Micropepsaceae bacterium]
MKIVVIGGTGLIGTKVVARLKAQGHEAIAASPASGVNAVTGEGLAEVLAGAAVVVDLSNSPSFAGSAAIDFFSASQRNLAAAEKAAGVGHHVALSVVGTERLQASTYFQGKLAQETLIKASGVPYSIVHATQFFEFLGAIAQGATVGDEVRVSSGGFQPIASDDVADVVTAIALGRPLNGTLEIAGPERSTMFEMVGRWLAAKADPRRAVKDDEALYFGVRLDALSLVPDEGARLGVVHLGDWMAAQAVAAGARGR